MQSILPLVSILPIFLLMIFIPYKTAGAYYGTIRIGFSWVIPALLFITIVKVGLDNVILRAAGE